MKAFEFRLQRILEFRRQQAEIEQARLDSLIRQVKQLEHESIVLEQQKAGSGAEMRNAELVTGEHWAALAQFEAYVVRRSADLQKQIAQMSDRTKSQRTLLIEAHRKVKLLERLRDRRVKEWTAACDRELEELAAESHLARLMSERRLTAA